MANVTKFTFSKLCNKLELNIDITLEMFLEHIYNDPTIYYIFNKKEIKFLFKYKNILEDEEKFVLEYYQFVPERQDQHNYVFETNRTMKYHLFNDCKYLASDYVDFRIPDDIKELGLEAVQYYRDWFKDQEYAEKFFNNTLKVNQVVFDYNMHFPPRYNVKPLNEDYALILELPNSQGIFTDSEFDHSEFLKKLDHLKTHFDNVFSCQVLKTLSKFQYLLTKPDSFINEKLSEIISPNFVTNYGLENIKEKLLYSRKIKFDLTQLLLDYFKWTYNFKNKSFDKITLEKFGLECCVGCKRKEDEEIILKEFLQKNN